MANKIIIPTGYMGSGSSAITDLIQEMKGYEASHGTFEYVFLHMPNGLFDLEDKLLYGNNSLRSDEAIHSFYNTMKELYDSKLWWVANYKKNLCEDFLDITQEYIDDLVQYKMDMHWYMQEKTTISRFIKLLFRKVLLILTNGRIVLKMPLNYENMLISLPSAKEFYAASRKYIYSLFERMGVREKNLILDQLLLPFNLWRMHNYFDENTECFVVERDPRDVFIMNKYVWGERDHNEVPYPVDAQLFCDYYKRLRDIERVVDSSHIHRIRFEDLIYRYDETVADICRILGLSTVDHINKKQYFDPDKSINNTQMFLDSKYKEEIVIIERELKDYLYDFPYEKKPNIDKSF